MAMRITFAPNPYPRFDPTRPSEFKLGLRIQNSLFKRKMGWLFIAYRVIQNSRPVFRLRFHFLSLPAPFHRPRRLARSRPTRLKHSHHRHASPTANDH